MGLTLALGLGTVVAGRLFTDATAGIPQWQSELFCRDPAFWHLYPSGVDGPSLLMVVLDRPARRSGGALLPREKSKNIRLLPPEPDVIPGRRYRRVPTRHVPPFFSSGK